MDNAVLGLKVAWGGKAREGVGWVRLAGREAVLLSSLGVIAMHHRHRCIALFRARAAVR